MAEQNNNDEKLVNWTHVENTPKLIEYSLVYNGVLCRFWVWNHNSEIPEGAYLLDALMTKQSLASS